MQPCLRSPHIQNCLLGSPVLPCEGKPQQLRGQHACVGGWGSDCKLCPDAARVEAPFLQVRPRHSCRTTTVLSTHLEKPT